MKQVIHHSTAVSLLKSQRLGSLRDRFKGKPIAPLAAGFMGTLRVQESKVKVHA